MRLRSRVDSNQALIVEALRAIGAGVLHLHQIGHGVPDILVWYGDRYYLLEIKDGSRPASQRKLTPDEAAWISAWPGKVHVVETIGQALRAIGVKCQHAS